MSKPPRICSCGRVVPHGVLCACQRAQTRDRNARHDARRPSAAKRGYNGEWRKARTEYLAAHPHCRECSKHGITRLATVVDHVIPHCGDKRLFWHRANWQPLCKPCHDSVKQRQESAPVDYAARRTRFTENPSSVSCSLLFSPTSASPRSNSSSASLSSRHLRGPERSDRTNEYTSIGSNEPFMADSSTSSVSEQLASLDMEVNVKEGAI